MTSAASRFALVFAAAAALLAPVALLAPPAVLAEMTLPPSREGVYVYDLAGIWSDRTEARAQAIAEAIRQRTQAQLAVVSWPSSDADVSTDTARVDAITIINTWGVGRAGVDDGLVVLFDMDAGSRSHGQIYLYAGRGFVTDYLNPDEAAVVVNDVMLPRHGTATWTGRSSLAWSASTTPSSRAATRIAAPTHSSTSCWQRRCLGSPSWRSGCSSGRGGSVGAMRGCPSSTTQSSCRGHHRGSRPHSRRCSAMTRSTRKPSPRRWWISGIAAS